MAAVRRVACASLLLPMSTPAAVSDAFALQSLLPTHVPQHAHSISAPLHALQASVICGNNAEGFSNSCRACSPRHPSRALPVRRGK